MALTMPSFLRRGDSTPAEPEVDEQPVAARPRAYTPSKKELGVATPKRRPGSRVIPTAAPNTKEGRKEQRDRLRARRDEERAGMLAGKEEYLMPRDKGPERRLVRDLVDSRRNAAGFFMPVAFIVILLTFSQAMPASVRLAGNLAWVIVTVAVVIDSFLLSRQIKKLVTARFPKSSVRPSSLYWYGITRSLSFRRMRMPAPQVKRGQAV